MKNILRLLTGYKTPISRTPNFFAPAYRTGRPLRLCALIFLCAFALLRDLKAQKAIHELPAKTTIDTNYLFIQGNPTTGKLYKTRGAALNAFISGGGGTATDTTSLSNRIDLKLNISDTAGLSNRIDDIGPHIDTTSLSNRIDAISSGSTDTTSLSNRIDAIPTISSFSKNAGRDSTILLLSSGTRYAVKDSIIGAGGGGGSQTLDQTLNEGNTTDTSIVFNPNPYATDYNFIKVNPIDTFSSQVPFRMTRWNVPQNSGAVAGNEGLMFGFNLNSGGGIIESGKPAIGFSIESNYLPDYATRYVEWHDLYIPSTTINGLTAGNQVRLSSYTINTATNNVDLYRRVGREYLMIPGSDVQYWLVQPGSFTMQNEAGTQGVSHEIAANRYTIAATGADTTMTIQDFDIVNFGGATLTNFEFPGALTLSNPTLSAAPTVLGIIDFKDATTPTKYMRFEPNGASNIMQIDMYGGMNKLHFSGADFIKFTFSDSYIQFDHEDIYFQGANTKFVYADDLKGILGVNSSIRWKEAWVRDGYFNQLSINNSSVHASAVMDLVSTTKGVLFPRMTTTEKNAISSPAEGLMVYDLTLHKLCIYTGSAWETITSI